MYVKILLIMLALALAGCGVNHVKIGDNSLFQAYLLQDKNYESIGFNPETNEFELRGIRSEVSQTIKATADAMLRVGAR